MIIPAFILSCIFTIGLAWRPNYMTFIPRVSKCFHSQDMICRKTVPLFMSRTPKQFENRTIKPLLKILSEQENKKLSKRPNNSLSRTHSDKNKKLRKCELEEFRKKWNQYKPNDEDDLRKSWKNIVSRISDLDLIKLKQTKESMLEDLDEILKKYNELHTIIHDGSEANEVWTSIYQKIESFFPCSKTFNYTPWIRFMQMWLAMIFICMIGVSIGFAASSLFRKTTSATIFLVVLFIFFMIFGRTFAIQPNMLGPIETASKISFENCYEFEAIIPWLFSFVSLGRYAFNIVLYPFSRVTCFETFPLLLFMVFSMFLTLFCLSNKNRNWKSLSR